MISKKIKQNQRKSNNLTGWVGEKVFRQRLQNGAALCSVQKIPFMISHKILYTPGRKITNFSG